MKVTLELSEQQDTWPQCVINFDKNIVTQTGIWGFNDALTANQINAKISYPSSKTPKNIFYILEFESQEDYIEFILRWS